MMSVKYAGSPLIANQGDSHSPAPSPGRAIYGFVLYVGTFLFFGLFLLWAFLPDSWLSYCGITYKPQRYWVLTVPVYICVTLLYALLMNFGYSLYITPSCTSLHSVTDKFQEAQLCRREPLGVDPDAVPPLADLHLDFVSRSLYRAPSKDTRP